MAEKELKMSEINVQRRKFLKMSMGVAAVAIAPGVFLFDMAHGKADANKVRWGMLIETANCAEGCNDCVTACNTENGLSGGVSSTDSQ